MTSVYVATTKGVAAVLWNSPVSHVMAWEGPVMDALVAMVYRAEFSEHVASTSTALGVLEREVKFHAKVT
jgi:hypothetical protein